METIKTVSKNINKIKQEMLAIKVVGISTVIGFIAGAIAFIVVML